MEVEAAAPDLSFGHSQGAAALQELVFGSYTSDSGVSPFHD
jgi:hypothetical protein